MNIAANAAFGEQAAAIAIAQAWTRFLLMVPIDCEEALLWCHDCTPKDGYHLRQTV